MIDMTETRQNIGRIAFRVLGKGAILYGCAWLFIASVVTRIRGLDLTAWDYFRVSLAVIILVVTGVGLLRLRRVAATFLSAWVLYPAYCSLWTALHDGGEPYPQGYVFAAVFAVPACLTICYWNSGIWSHRQKHQPR